MTQEEAFAWCCTHLGAWSMQDPGRGPPGTYTIDVLWTPGTEPPLVVLEQAATIIAEAGARIGTTLRHRLEQERGVTVAGAPMRYTPDAVAKYHALQSSLLTEQPQPATATLWVGGQEVTLPTANVLAALAEYGRLVRAELTRQERERGGP